MENQIHKNYENLSKILKENEIDEYDYIPLENKQTVFLLVGTKLAINSHHLKQLVVLLSKQFMEMRKKMRMKAGGDDDDTKGCESLSNLSQCLLLFIPDQYTAWNCRKELIQCNHLSPLTDLSLTTLILTKHPKSSETFNHRRWLITHLLETFDAEKQQKQQQQLFKEFNKIKSTFIFKPSTHQTHLPFHHTHSLNHQTRCSQCSLLPLELSLSLSTSSKYPNNYPSWNHRLWAIQHLNCFPSKTLMWEIEATELFMKHNPSDNTAYNHRQSIILMMMITASTTSESFITTTIADVAEHSTTITTSAAVENATTATANVANENAIITVTTISTTTGNEATTTTTVTDLKYLTTTTTAVPIIVETSTQLQNIPNKNTIQHIKTDSNSILDLTSYIYDLLRNDFLSIQESIVFYQSTHQSMFYHKRFLISTMMYLLKKYDREDGVDSGNAISDNGVHFNVLGDGGSGEKFENKFDVHFFKAMKNINLQINEFNRNEFLTLIDSEKQKYGIGMVGTGFREGGKEEVDDEVCGKELENDGVGARNVGSWGLVLEKQYSKWLKRLFHENV